MFNSLFRLENEVRTECDEAHLFVGSARKGRQGVIVLANTLGEAVSVRLELLGFSVSETEVLRLDEENRYTLTGETAESGEITIPPYSCVELRLFDLN